MNPIEFVGKCYIHKSNNDGSKSSIRKIISYYDDKLYYDVMYYDEPFSPAYFPAKDCDNYILVGAHEVAIEVGYLSEIKEEEYERILKEELSAA